MQSFNMKKVTMEQSRGSSTNRDTLTPLMENTEAIELQVSQVLPYIGRPPVSPRQSNLLHSVIKQKKTTGARQV